MAAEVQRNAKVRKAVPVQLRERCRGEHDLPPMARVGDGGRPAEELPPVRHAPRHFVPDDLPGSAGEDSHPDPNAVECLRAARARLRPGRFHEEPRCIIAADILLHVDDCLRRQHRAPAGRPVSRWPAFPPRPFLAMPWWEVKAAPRATADGRRPAEALERLLHHAAPLDGLVRVMERDCEGVPLRADLITLAILDTLPEALVMELMRLYHCCGEHGPQACRVLDICDYNGNELFWVHKSRRVTASLSLLSPFTYRPVPQASDEANDSESGDKRAWDDDGHLPTLLRGAIIHAEADFHLSSGCQAEPHGPLEGGLREVLPLDVEALELELLVREHGVLIGRVLFQEPRPIDEVVLIGDPLALLEFLPDVHADPPGSRPHKLVDLMHHVSLVHPHYWILPTRRYKRNTVFRVVSTIYPAPVQTL
mmetsp:Transcript_35789/g.84831  ORF Transcript_35789/g.84831 Transcript_35789/m.84831 type:complete len:423 (-) Transcript_35789:1287-2555(-)